MANDQPTVRVQHGETTLDVPIDSLTLPEGYRVLAPGQAPEGFVSSDFMQAELSRRLKDKVKPDDLIEDDDFFRRAAAKRGIQLDDSLKPVAKLDPKQIDQLHAQWHREKLEPLMKELDAYREEAEQGRMDVLIRDLMQAAVQANVRPEHMKSLFGKTPGFIRDIAEQAQWDGERRKWFFKDPVTGNPIYSDKPTSDNPYAGADKFMEILRSRDTEHVYFDDQRQRGSGLTNNGQVTGNQIVLTREQAKDPAIYRAAKERAAKEGKQVVFTD